MVGEEESFFPFCDLNETFICLSKLSMEACPQMKYELVVKRKEDTSCRIMLQKYHNFKRKYLKIKTTLSQKSLPIKLSLTCLSLEDCQILIDIINKHGNICLTSTGSINRNVFFNSFIFKLILCYNSKNVCLIFSRA